MTHGRYPEGAKSALSAYVRLSVRNVSTERVPIKIYYHKYLFLSTPFQKINPVKINAFLLTTAFFFGIIPHRKYISKGQKK